MNQEIIDNIRKNLIIIGRCVRCGEHLVKTDPFFISAEGDLFDTYCAEVETEVPLYKPKIVHNVKCRNCGSSWNAILPNFVQALECPECTAPVLLTNGV